MLKRGLQLPMLPLLTVMIIILADGGPATIVTRRHRTEVKGTFLLVGRRQQTFPFKSVLDHIFDFSTATMYLPLRLPKKVRLRLIELLSPEVVLVEFTIRDYFGLLLLISHHQMSMLLFDVVVAADGLLGVEEGPAARSQLGLGGLLATVGGRLGVSP